MTDNKLQSIISLVNDSLISFDEGAYFLEFIPNEVNSNLLKVLNNGNAIEQIIQNKNVIDSEQVKIGLPLKVEIAQFALQKFGYYENLEALVNANDFSVPKDFYVRSKKYLHLISDADPLIEAYFRIVALGNCIVDLAKFVADDTARIVYLLQDKSAVALPLTYELSILENYHPDLNNIRDFVSDIEEHSDKKKIYVKELIDFLNQESTESRRFEYLFKNFDAFYGKCEAAYAFYLSDFTYSKLKLELESAILDYSKNIRSIINDSQNKLIAIPAAFLVASSQLEFNKVFSTKNFLITISSFVFSVLIEIFIRNQESSLRIFIDNITSYKTTFNIKNEGSEVKAIKTLKGLIASSFSAIDDELGKQRDRLRTIRLINWAMSVFLVIIDIGLLFYNKPEPISPFY